MTDYFDILCRKISNMCLKIETKLKQCTFLNNNNKPNLLIYEYLRRLENNIIIINIILYCLLTISAYRLILKTRMQNVNIRRVKF